MDISPANLSIFFTGLSTQYQAAYQSTPVHWQRLAFLKPSNSEIDRDGWMAKIPRMRQWVGDRVIRNVSARTYDLANLPFELTLEVDKFKLEDDSHGIYSPLVQMMGAQAAKWPDDMLFAKLMANTELCFDGKAFFADDHPVDLDNAAKGTYDNNLALALTPDNFNDAFQAMCLFKGEDERPMGVVPNLLVVPPQLALKARQILQGGIIAPATFAGQTQVGGNTNVLSGMTDLLVIPELGAAATTWYLLDTSKPIKPFLFQQRKAPVLTPRTDPSDPNVFDKHSFLYGVEARGNVGYSLPFLALRSVG